MMYLDSNVFIYAALDSGEKGTSASALLRRIGTGESDAVTSALAMDEVLWKLLKAGPRTKAVGECRKLIGLSNLRVLPVRLDDLHTAFTLMEAHASLKPRDAIHAGVAVNAGVFTIVSDDTDFDDIKGIERRPLDRM